MPSDHYIESKEDFAKTLDKAISLASNNFLVTIGAKAKESNSNYGYIVPSKIKINNYFKIKNFVEKPSEKLASKLIKNNGLWNTGIIVVKNKINMYNDRLIFFL